MLTALEVFVDRFLQALSDPEGGQAFHAMHSPDAPLRHESTLRCARDVDSDGFCQAHRQINISGRGKLPEFIRQTLREAPEIPDASESVAWFEVVEAREPRKLLLAIGLRRQGTEFRAGWCTLAGHLENWSYEDGRLRSLADYPWMRRAEPAMPRSLLDASYFRHHWSAAVAFTTLADTRFGCHMSTACCKHDFEITLPPEAQLLIDAIPWQSVAPRLTGTRLAPRSDGRLQLKSMNETCRFLGSRRQCLIHQTLGQQPFGACCVFPYAFAQTPEGIAVSLSPICGSTRMGLGASVLERKDDLLERLVHSEPRRANGFRLTPDREISWEIFRDIEKALCDCFSAEYLPLRRRLHIGTLLLSAIRRGETFDMNRSLNEPIAPITPGFRQAIRGMLSKILAWDRSALKTLPQELPATLSCLEVSDAPIVARILRYTMYSKVYSYPFDLTTGLNLVIVLYLVTIIMQAASDGPLSDDMWQELGSLGVHGLLKDILLEGVPHEFRTLFGTGEFGGWLLAV
jgi:hypothetical protein